MKKNYTIMLCMLLFLIHNVHIASANKHIPSKPSKIKTRNNNVIILLHLYNLDLMDEFIIRINNFITLNKSQNFYIKINVPVDSRINNFNTLKNNETVSAEQQNFFYTQCIESAPYHPELITYDNALPLYRIADYLTKKLKCDNTKIQVIFSENRGVDVGSFLLLLDQVIEQKIPHDYIVKLHTKTNKPWREKLLKILDCKISEIALQKAECVYGCSFYLSSNYSPKIFFNVMKQVQNFLDYFNLPYIDGFSHASGTMFIASNKITKFFSPYNRVELFNLFNLGYPKGKSFLLEHGFEVFLGYLFKYKKFKSIYLSTQTHQDILNFIHSTKNKKK